PGVNGYVHLHLANPATLVPGDRFIIRQFSPLVTIGGGEVLDNSPRWRRRQLERHIEFLKTIRLGDPKAHLLARTTRRAEDGLLISEAVAETGWTESTVNAI